MVEYYQPRPDVAALVPRESRVVLDVGCGAGLLGAQLKADNPERVVYGIEPESEAAARARTALDGVLESTAEAPWPDDWRRPDCLVFADVLEHMTDPWSTLRNLCARLPSGADVVLSVPNAAHYSVVGPLVLYGRWEYRDQGILDRTHLRFFTRKTAFELVSGAGLHVKRVERRLGWPAGTLGGGLRLLTTLERHREDRVGVRAAGRRLLDHITVQYLFLARKH